MFNNLFSVYYFKIFHIIRYPTQKSAKIQLRQGSFYFMEALLKEGGGGDHLSVGVKLPGRFTRPKPLPKNYLFVNSPGMSITSMQVQYYLNILSRQRQCRSIMTVMGIYFIYIVSCGGPVSIPFSNTSF